VGFLEGDQADPSSGAPARVADLLGQLFAAGVRFLGDGELSRTSSSS